MYSDKRETHYNQNLRDSHIISHHVLRYKLMIITEKIVICIVIHIRLNMVKILEIVTSYQNHMYCDIYIYIYVRLIKIKI